MSRPPETAPPETERAPLDDTVRDLILLQSQALRAAQAQLDAHEARFDELELLRGGADAGDNPASLKLSSRNAPREAAVAALDRLDAKTKREDERDEPAATYDRVRYAVSALAVITCLLNAIEIFEGGLEGMAYQVVFLLLPLVITGLYLLFFGTLDSSAMAAAATRAWRSFFIVLGALSALVRVADGLYAQAVFYIVFMWFGCAYYAAWLLSTARERMRTRFKGTLSDRAHNYTSRLLQIASFQMALLVQGLAQGIGANSYGRNRATSAFSFSLVVAWALSACVFDAGDTDPKRATKLRLSLRESAALAASALYVLTGLACYVMAQQGDPDASTATMVSLVSYVCMLVAAVLAGRRLAEDAAKKDAARDSRVRPRVAAGFAEM